MILIFSRWGQGSKIWRFNNIEEEVISDFGFDCRERESSSYKNTIFLHYCQPFLVNEKKIWFKQDYTEHALNRPWENICNYKDIDETSYNYVLKLIHNLIEYQKSDTYINPKIIKRNELILSNSNLSKSHIL